MSNGNNGLKKGLGIHARRVIAYIVLIVITFFCLFWFYILFINATRSNGELQSGFPFCRAHTPGTTGSICCMERFLYGMGC